MRETFPAISRRDPLTNRHVNDLGKVYRRAALSSPGSNLHGIQAAHARPPRFDQRTLIVVPAEEALDDGLQHVRPRYLEPNAESDVMIESVTGTGPWTVDVGSFAPSETQPGDVLFDEAEPQNQFTIESVDAGDLLVRPTNGDNPPVVGDKQARIVHTGGRWRTNQLVNASLLDGRDLGTSYGLGDKLVGYWDEQRGAYVPIPSSAMAMAEFHADLLSGSTEIAKHPTLHPTVSFALEISETPDEDGWQVVNGRVFAINANNDYRGRVRTASYSGCGIYTFLVPGDEHDEKTWYLRVRAQSRLNDVARLEFAALRLEAKCDAGIPATHGPPLSPATTLPARRIEAECNNGTDGKIQFDNFTPEVNQNEMAEVVVPAGESWTVEAEVACDFNVEADPRFIIWFEGGSYNIRQSDGQNWPKVQHTGRTGWFDIDYVNRDIYTGSFDDNSVHRIAIADAPQWVGDGTPDAPAELLFIASVPIRQIYFEPSNGLFYYWGFDDGTAKIFSHDGTAESELIQADNMEFVTDAQNGFIFASVRLGFGNLRSELRRYGIGGGGETVFKSYADVQTDIFSITVDPEGNRLFYGVDPPGGGDQEIRSIQNDGSNDALVWQESGTESIGFISHIYYNRRDGRIYMLGTHDMATVDAFTGQFTIINQFEAFLNVFNAPFRLDPAHVLGDEWD